VKVDGTSATFPADFLGGGADPTLSPLSRTFTPRSVSLGVLHDLPWNMVASITGNYVERAPRAPELFSKGAHDASGTFEIGNAALKPEAAKTAEVGLKRTTGSLRFEVNAYYTQYEGFIYKRLTGNTCGEDFQSCAVGAGGEFRQIVYSQQNATFRGAEASAQYDVMELASGMFGIDGQYDIVRATFADGTNVPRMPPQRVGGGMWWRDSNWYTRVGLLHAFGQNDISGFETPTGGYNLLKAEITYTTKLSQNDFGMKEMKVGIVGTNLLNEEVRNSVSFRKDEVLLPGAGVKLFANFTF
jgi:iron complex outermembrane receptor protein